MELLEQLGGLTRFAEAIDWTGERPDSTLKIGIRNEVISAHADRGLTHILGQMYGVLGPGLIMAEHALHLPKLSYADASGEDPAGCAGWGGCSAYREES